ncbi:inorganic diphosphatase [Arthrobacter sp. ISL-72]|uniref:inorganic diphosphatase n=1 Tax=Arthrobacter sp. ISL-72 TaxID=2819114 RepID=UPI0037C08176
MRDPRTAAHRAGRPRPDTGRPELPRRGYYKIIAVPADDREAGNRISTLEDLGTRWQEQITHHFNHYKDLQPGTHTRVLGRGTPEEAATIVGECSQRWQDQKTGAHP